MGEVLPFKADVAKKYMERQAEDGTFEKIESTSLKAGDVFKLFNPNGTEVFPGRLYEATGDAVGTVDGGTAIPHKIIEDGIQEAETEPVAAREATKPDENADDRLSASQKLAKRLGAEGMKVLSTSTRELERALNDEDLKAISEKLVHHTLEGVRIENKKKDVAKTLGDEQKGHEAAAAVLAEQYDSKMWKGTRVIMIAADPILNIRRVYDVESGEEVAQEAIQVNDLQEALPLEAKATKPKAAKEPKVVVPDGPLGIGYEAPAANKFGVEINGDEHIHSSVVNEIVGEAFKDESESVAVHESISEKILGIETIEISQDGKSATVTDNTGLTMTTNDETVIKAIAGFAADSGEFAKVKLKVSSAGAREILEFAFSDYQPTGDDIDESGVYPLGVDPERIEEVDANEDPEEG